VPDQADGLRSLFARRRPSLLIVAGGDACKAAVAVHYAREAAAGGRATVLIDGTAGQLASACDLACRYELAHVLAGDKTLADVLRALTPHLLLLPAARALSRVGSLSPEEQGRLSEALSSGITQALADAGSQETQVDLIVVNAEEAQAARAVEAFGRDAHVVIVASEQAGSLRGAYAEMKSLMQHGVENFDVVVPSFDEAAPSGVAFANLANTARRFLDIELKDGGTVLLAGPHGTGPTTTIRGPSVVAARSVGVSDDEPDSLSSSLSIDEVHHAAAVA